MGIGGGIITKKMLFVALLVMSLSFGCITAANAAEANATQIQTSNTNTLDENGKTQTESEINLSKSINTQESVDNNIKKVKSTSEQNIQTENTQNNVISNEGLDNGQNIQNTLQTTEQKSNNTVTSQVTNNIQTTNNTTAKPTTSNQSVNNTNIDPYYNAAGSTTAPTTSTSTPNVYFTVSQIQTAASKVRAYIENNHQLPSYVQIDGYKINMSQLLYLMTRSLIQINSGTNYAITLRSFSAPASPIDDIVTGYIYKSEYLHIASDVKNYMLSSGKTPDFAYQTSLGTHLGYHNLIYMFSMILDYHRTSNLMAAWAGMKPYSAVKKTAYGTAGDPTVAPVLLKTAASGTTFTISQINGAASRVKAYVDTYKKLPNYVQISSYKINMSQFLYLMTKALLQINSGTNNLIAIKSFTAPTSQQDNIVSGSIPKSEYLNIASDVKNYMDSSGKTPDFAYQTSLGTYLGFGNMIYMFSKILVYQTNNGVLPSSISMKSWSSLTGSYDVPAELQQYLAATANCQVNDGSIKSLAASITAGATSSYDKAWRIFNWVRDNLSYSFYYDTKYGAVGALNARTGNCVDTSHLLVALERAAGIPARYVHGYAQFSSGSWYGHVWAQVWVNGKWYTCDASSNYNDFGVINSWNTGTATIYGTYASLPF